jgi:triose/dihydroxyacetone kinase / FAD-AMP lyase (cyclizing)
MSAKHFINDPTHLVHTALQSLTVTNPSVALDLPNKIVYCRPSDAPSRVSIVSGGGSGHEPSFGAMVGPGLLTAAVAGTIFASPSTEQVRTAIASRVKGDKGVLVTVMNYTGDILNFGVAVEKARAAGLNVEMVVVGDDVGVGRAKGGKVGRRGIAGTVLVHKISGALAAMGRPLEEVVKVARLTANNIVSVGASLEHVHVPGRAAPKADEEGQLKVGEVELGMGIHNEPGSGRETVALPDLVSKMLAQLLDQNDKDRAFLNVNSNEIVLMINNLGGVSVLELGGITMEVVGQLDKHYGIRPVRVLSGTYMTSLNGLGFSITLLNVVNTNIGGPGMVELLDYPCEATGWSAPISKNTWEAKNMATLEDTVSTGGAVKPSGMTLDPVITAAALKEALRRVIDAEPEITRYDTVVGDGDCGIGLKRGAEGKIPCPYLHKFIYEKSLESEADCLPLIAVLKHLEETKLTGDAVVDVANIVPVVESTMDGTSGALYAIFLNALVHALRILSPGDATPTHWAGALRQSCDALSKYTPARVGDRTLMDALLPFVEALEKTKDVQKAAEAAQAGAESTEGMKASLGRSVYVGGDGFEQVPDPGTWGLACFFLGLAAGKA